MYQLLIVDDEPKIRKGIISCYPWEQMGYHIIGEANDGYEALDLIHTQHVDVVLTDVKMDNYSGLDLCSALYAEKNSVIVVILSGYDEFTYAQKAMQYGVKRYLLKPTNYNEVIETFLEIKNFLDDLQHTISKSPNEHVGKYSQIILDVQEYIHKDYNNASLNGAADYVGLSSFYLSRLFKQESGMNFSDYLLQERMKEANRLLADYKNKIYEISSYLGYDCPRSFTRVFTKYYGKTPNQFRKERL